VYLRSSDALDFTKKGRKITYEITNGIIDFIIFLGSGMV